MKRTAENSDITTKWRTVDIVSYLWYMYDELLSLQGKREMVADVLVSDNFSQTACRLFSSQEDKRKNLSSSSPTGLKLLNCGGAWGGGTHQQNKWAVICSEERFRIFCCESCISEEVRVENWQLNQKTEDYFYCIVILLVLLKCCIGPNLGCSCSLYKIFLFMFSWNH